MLVRTATGAAGGQFAVNDNGRYGADAVLLHFGGHLGLVHVVDDHLVRGTGNALDGLDGFPARRSTGTEDFNFLPLSPRPVPPIRVGF